MPVHVRWWRLVGVIGFYALLVYGGQTANDWMIDRFEINLLPSSRQAVDRMILVAAVLYVLLLALPFMPGVEIGLGLMIMVGPEVCPLVYLSTVLALLLSFAVGRLVPVTAIVSVCDWLGLERARNMVARLAPLPAEERLDVLLDRVPARSLSFLLRHRYLALAALLNLPGNALVGGGGGITMVAGMSRIFRLPVFVLTVALAVSPVPLIYYLLGDSS